MLISCTADFTQCISRPNLRASSTTAMLLSCCWHSTTIICSHRAATSRSHEQRFLPDGAPIHCVEITSPPSSTILRHKAFVATPSNPASIMAITWPSASRQPSIVATSHAFASLPTTIQDSCPSYPLPYFFPHSRAMEISCGEACGEPITDIDGCMSSRLQSPMPCNSIGRKISSSFSLHG